MSGPPRPQARSLALPLAAFAVCLVAPLPVALGLAAVALAWRLGRRILNDSHQRAELRSPSAATSASGRSLALGTDAHGRAVTVSARALGAHTLILGASGSGKSTTMLRLLGDGARHGAGLIAIDLKGSPAFAQELRDLAEATGRPLRVWSLDGAENWNPLAHGNATELKDKLIATERFSEPHYQRAAERYVQNAIRVLQRTSPDSTPTLSRVVELLEPAQLAAAGRALPQEDAQRLSRYVGSLTPDQLSAVRGLASRLAVISESHTGQFMGAERAIDVRRALTGDEIVLFSLNSSRYGQLAAQLGTLAVQDIVSATGTRLESEARPSQSLVAIDEFSALEGDNVLALMARGREAGVGVVLATQELADLDRAGRGLRDQILGNTAVKISHRQDVPESALTVARLAGKVKTWDRTYQERPGPLGSRLTAGSTVREREDYAVDPEQVRTLRTGEALVIAKVPEASAQVARITPPDSGRAAAPRVNAAGRRPGDPRRNVRGGRADGGR